MNSENFKIFDNNRPEFEVYGFKVEKWSPKRMSRADRHNEIEINLLTGGSITYLINDRKIRVCSKRLVVFWALVPHQIIHFENKAPYYVCTIPFSQFMSWQLPSSFVDLLLKGEIVNATTNKNYQYDKYLMENWLHDISTGDLNNINVSALEVRARLNRLAHSSVVAECNEFKDGKIISSPIDLVEQMIIFIAQNYRHPIKNEDIGQAVGLHPDYANSIFKKAFGMTLNKYILQQRILYVQRQLSVNNNSITEIAFEAGFNSFSHFNTAFKKKCHCSPREYRKKHSSF